jgi:hypothetical protein
MTPAVGKGGRTTEQILMDNYNALLDEFKAASKAHRLAAHLYRNRLLAQTEYLEIRAKMDTASRHLDAAEWALRG